MAAKRKKRLKNSFKIFVALFLLMTVIFVAVVRCGLRKDDEADDAQNEIVSDTTTPTTEDEATLTEYNEFIDIKTVKNDGKMQNYPILKVNDNITKKLATLIDADGEPISIEKAYFNHSYFSVSARKADGEVRTFNFSVKSECLITLAEAAPRLYGQYGEVPFYLDASDITVYTSEGKKTVSYSEYDGIKYLPYNPPEYQPAADGEKVIALTFDDGPHRPEITGKILDKLIQRRAKATFFVLGFECARNAETLNRVVKCGCEIGNHSWHHDKLNKITRDEAIKSITETQKVIYETTGVYPKIMRPPYGDERTDIMEELGLFHVEWNVDPEDWNKKNADDIVNHVKEKAESGNIVLMHDIYDASCEAALELIDYFCDNGWRLVTVSELFDFKNHEFDTQIYRYKQS